MGETMAPVDVKDPMVQAHFQDFAGTHDSKQYSNLLRILPRHQHVFAEVGAVAQVGFSDGLQDLEPRIVVSSERELTDEEKDRILQEVPADL